MKTNTIVRKVKRAIAKDLGILVSELPDDGYRYRITKAAKAHGDNVIEVSSPYYYQSDADCQKRADDFVLYANSMGIIVTLHALHDNVRFNDQKWPKQSWAMQYFDVRFHYVDQQSA